MKPITQTSGNCIRLLGALALLTASTLPMADAGPIKIRPRMFASELPVDVTFNQGVLATRYLIKTNNSGDRVKNQLQHRILFDVTVGVMNDKVTLTFKGGTGGDFQGSWGNTGYGKMGDSDYNMYLKELYLTYSPIKGVKLSAGSMQADYGAGTEGTYFDADHFITGYKARAEVKDGYLVVTTGNLGDYKDPSAFNRFDKMDDFNFVQAAVTQQIAEIVKASLDYTWAEDDHYVRAAVNFDLRKWTKFADSLIVQDLANMSTLGSNDDDFQNIVAMTLTKKFKDVYKGLDVQTALTYRYNDGIELLLADKAIEGHQVQVEVSLPNLVQLGPITGGVYAAYIQSLDDWDAWRAESGIIFKL